VEFKNPFEQETLLAPRLLALRRLCTVLAVSVLLLLVITAFLLSNNPRPASFYLPDAVPISLTLFSMILILLSSRLRSAIVRRAIPRNPVLKPETETVLAAYKRGTLVSFLLLETAALIGIGVALVSWTLFYGLILCIAVLFAMLTRWPNAAQLGRILRGRSVP